MLQLTSTLGAGVDRLKVLVHGPTGAGKTRLSATTDDLEHTLVISAEAGLLSLREHDIAVVDITKQVKAIADGVTEYWPPMDALLQTWATLARTEHPYTWVVLDSLTEIAEACLSAEKAGNKDGRKAYGEMNERMVKLIKSFRDLPFNVVMFAKQDHISDDGRLLYGPSMPGKRLAGGVAYYFDEVFALRTQADAEGNVQRWLQTQRDAQYEAKDRSGALDIFEPADLGHIARKIQGHMAPNPASQEATHAAA